jgi:amino acid transporter
MNVERKDLEAFGYRQELKRSLPLSGLLVYGLVFIGPIAPITVFGIVYNASRGMVPLVYLVGLAAMFFNANSYTTMARLYPLAGSAYVYATRSIGDTVGFLAGWAILLDYLLLPTLSNVVVAIAIHALVPWLSLSAVVISVLLLTTIVNYLGIESTARASFALLILQLVVLAAFMAVGVVALWNGVAGARLATAPLFNPAVFSPGVILGAASLGVLSFLGFDAISTLAEESEGGAGAIAKATLVSLGIAAALFVGQTYLASLFVLGRTGFPLGDATDAAFYDIAALIGGGWLKFLVAFPGIVLGAIAGSLASQAATARLIYGMARDGKLPRGLAHVHPRRKVPERAILLVAGITLALGVLLVSRLELLTSVVCFGALLGFILVNASVLAHYRSEGLGGRRAKLISPALGLIITGFVLWNTSSNAKIVGVAWTIVGLCYYAALRIRGRGTTLVQATD